MGQPNIIRLLNSTYNGVEVCFEAESVDTSRLDNLPGLMLHGCRRVGLDASGKVLFRSQTPESRRFVSSYNLAEPAKFSLV